MSHCLSSLVMGVFLFAQAVAAAIGEAFTSVSTGMFACQPYEPLIFTDKPHMADPVCLQVLVLRSQTDIITALSMELLCHGSTGRRRWHSLLVVIP